MKQNNNNGFTLIELLIVVLIIGVISAIAVPKYQLAGDKARMNQLQIAVKALSEAQKRYMTANGTKNLSYDLSALDVRIEGGTFVTKKWENDRISFSWGICSLSGSGDSRSGIYCHLDNPGLTYLQYLTTSQKKTVCCSHGSSGERGKRLCQATFPDAKGKATDSFCGIGGTVYNYYNY